MIKAVFLDVDDTLVDYQRAAQAAFAAAVGSLDRYDEFNQLDHYHRFLNGELDFQSARELRMAAFLELVGREADGARAAEFERVRYEGLSHHYTLFDDALPCLEQLRERDLLVGVITNNESVHQRAKLAAVGLDQLVDAIVISDEFGVPKPDRRIFAHACELLGVRADEAVHVGDNATADAEGAHAAGLRALWLDRAGVRDDRTRGYAVISGLHELVSHLA